VGRLAFFVWKWLRWLRRAGDGDAPPLASGDGCSRTRAVSDRPFTSSPFRTEEKIAVAGKPISRANLVVEGDTLARTRGPAGSGGRRESLACDGDVQEGFLYREEKRQIEVRARTLEERRGRGKIRLGREDDDDVASSLPYLHARPGGEWAGNRLARLRRRRRRLRRGRPRCRPLNLHLNRAPPSIVVVESVPRGEALSPARCKSHPKCSSHELKWE